MSYFKEIWQNEYDKTGLHVYTSSEIGLVISGPKFATGSFYSYDEFEELCKEHKISQKEKEWLEQSIKAMAPDFPRNTPNISKLLIKTFDFCDEKNIKVIKY